jgi:PAS domain S-box-containing protein
MVVVPLVNQDEVLGVIKVVAKRPRSFDDLDTYTLQLMAGFVAASLAQAERYKAELASEQRFRLLFEKNVAAAFFTTPEGEVEAVNDALIRMLGFESREEALGDQVWSRYEKESDRKELLDLLRTRKSLERHPVRLRRRDGTVINVVMNIEMVRGVGKTYLIGTMLETAGDTATSPKEPS